MNNIKRSFYIFCAMILGFLLQLFLHAAVEIWYLGLLLSNFQTYSFGFSWSTWFLIHHVLSVVLFFLGVWFGYRAGVRWWQIVYVERSASSETSRDGRHWFLQRRMK